MLDGAGVDGEDLGVILVFLKSLNCARAEFVDVIRPLVATQPVILRWPAGVVGVELPQVEGGQSIAFKRLVFGPMVAHVLEPQPDLGWGLLVGIDESGRSEADGQIVEEAALPQEGFALPTGVVRGVFVAEAAEIGAEFKQAGEYLDDSGKIGTSPTVDWRQKYIQDDRLDIIKRI